ncbi:adhesion G protein-coupled receptor E3-like [Brachyhypopomus gauderio]|uniref:adhesion G protein-coupled receptor E3-like n=1 Tax=Brachyhypopomus gauderio TaxID=698409 RepID=UPI004041A6CD
MMFNITKNLQYTNNSDALITYGNTILKVTVKLVSALVNTTETNYSMYIPLNGLDIQVFAVGPNTSINEVIHLERSNNAWMEIDLIKISQKNNGSAAVAFMIYTNMSSMLNSILFNTSNNTVKTIISTVVSATLPKTNITQFTEPVNITLRHNTNVAPNSALICVEWKETGWTVDGCTIIESHSSYSVCSYVHPSTFALLMLTNPSMGDNSSPLLLLNTVAMTVGLVFLSLNLLTFALCLRNMRVTNVAQINLCVSLLLAHLLFLLTQQFLQYLQPIQAACAIIAGILHFLFLSSFVWMFIDAGLIFIVVKNLTKIRSKHVEVLNWKCLSIIGYLIPMIVVSVSAGLVPEGYGSEQCWLKMDKGFIWSFLGPVSLILASNLILFFIILLILTSTLKRIKSDFLKVKEPMNRSKVVEILFLILNSQQGTFIFLVHCVFNQEVRQEYRRIWRSLLKKKVDSMLMSQSSGK